MLLACALLAGCGGGRGGLRGEGKIAFNSDRDGDYEIFVMNADGSDVVSLGQQGFPTSWGG